MHDIYLKEHYHKVILIRLKLFMKNQKILFESVSFYIYIYIFPVTSKNTYLQIIQNLQLSFTAVHIAFRGWSHM